LAELREALATTASLRDDLTASVLAADRQDQVPADEQRRLSWRRAANGGLSNRYATSDSFLDEWGGTTDFATPL
jgi:hypothetical protein